MSASDKRRRARATGPADDVYSPAEVAKRLRVSEWWLKEQARRGRIPFTWLGGSYKFTPEHVKEIIHLFEVWPTTKSTGTAAEPTAKPPRPARAPTAKPTVRLTAKPPRRGRGPQSAA